MSKKLFTALEEEQLMDPAPPAEDHEIEHSLQQAEGNLEHADETADAVAEGSSIVDTVEVIGDQVASTIEAENGIDEQAALVAGVSIEHFYERMGYVSKTSAAVAMESIVDKKGDRLELSKVALEDLKVFQGKTMGALTVAQEGILARLGNTLKLAFTSRERIRERLMHDLDTLKTHGSKSDLIKEPGWGRSFARLGQRKIAGKDAVSLVKDYAGLMTNSAFQKLIGDYTDFIENLTKEISKSRFIANDDAVKAIQDMNGKADEIRIKADKLVSQSRSTAKNDPDFEPLTPEEGKKLVDSISSVFEDSKLSVALRRLDDAIIACNNTLFEESMTRLAGANAKDIRAARQVVIKANPALIDIMSISGRLDRLAFACANYLRASAA